MKLKYCSHLQTCKFTYTYTKLKYGCLQVPSRIEKLIADKQLYAAVQLHVQSMLVLEREGLQVVGYKLHFFVLNFNWSLYVFLAY